MNLESVFAQLNLTKEHAEVYFANLEWGDTIITNIARKSKIPRTTVYLLMEDLLAIGLITQRLEQNKTIYSAADPHILEILLQKKALEVSSSLQHVNESMNNLKAIQNANPKKPKVEYLEGAEGIMQAYDRSLEAKELWVQCLTEEYTKIVPEKYMNEYFDKLFKKSNTKTKEILKLEDEAYVSEYGSEKNLQLRVPVKQKTETDFWVYDSKVTFVSFNPDKPYALIIEDEGIAQAMKHMFDLAWKQAAVVDPGVKAGQKVKTEF